MSDLGGRLKQARLAKGVSLRDIATATKISVVALEALERNDYSRLPGGIFSRAFVRAYALAVGLEPEAAVSEFLVEFARYESEAEHSAKRPDITPDDREFVERQRRALRTLRLVLVGAALIALVAVAYLVLVWWPATNSGAASSPSAPRTLAAPASLPVSLSVTVAAGSVPLRSHLR
jgi:cytoskeletal protein RodZ